MIKRMKRAMGYLSILAVVNAIIIYYIIKGVFDEGNQGQR